LEVKRDILWRVYLCFLGIIILGVLILGRVFYIQQFQGGYWQKMSDSLHQRIVSIDAERGTIYSEDGQMLSTSLPTFDIYMDFGADGLREKNGKRFRENLDSFAWHLSSFFKDKSKSAYINELKTAYREKERYYLLKKKLSFEQYKKFREFPLVRLGRNKSGVIAEVKTIRLMPFGLMANRTIGLARENADNVGLERTYDSLLRGQTGSRLVRFIAGGAAMPVEGYEIEPVKGKDIVSTIDVRIQDIAQTALMKMMVQSQSQYGTCIVMETKTGKIKAIANLGRQGDGTYWEDYNYALRTTEPGSTIKLATLLSVLSEGQVSADDNLKVGTAGTAFVGVRNVNDAERAPKDVMTLAECFSHSSNVGMSMAAYQSFSSRPDKFKEYLHKYRLDQRTGIDLAGEEKPRMATLKKNKEGLHAMITMSFGYAIEVSPLQTLTLYNAVANDGKMMKPYLVNSILKDGVLLKQFGPEVLQDKLADDKIIAVAKKAMESVATEGTGKYAFKGMSFPVAGKTGTAHVADGNIKYTDGIYQASFAGYFPANNPLYSCIVVIRTRPHAPLHYGGQLAAPVFREIAEKVYAAIIRTPGDSPVQVQKDSTGFFYAGNTMDFKKVLGQLQIAYKDSADEADWSSVYSSGSFAVVRKQEVSKNLIPDLKGMGLKDALYLLEERGVKVQAKGKGKVIAQSANAGTPVFRGMVVYIELG